MPVTDTFLTPTKERHRDIETQRHRETGTEEKKDCLLSDRQRDLRNMRLGKYVDRDIYLVALM